MPHTRTIAYTPEAEGEVATCDTCGWLRWEPSSTEARRQGKAHACRKGDPCLLCHRAYRLGEGPPPQPRTGAPPHPECRHYMSAKARAQRLEVMASARAAVAR